MKTPVENLVHEQMARHDTKRLSDGYEIEHRIGVSRLRFLPCSGGTAEFPLSAIAEIRTDFSQEAVPSFTELDLARLNARALSGAYQLNEGHLGMCAQYSLYDTEPAVEVSARCILDAFSEQMGLGFSNIAAYFSAEQLAEERAYQDFPRNWKQPIDPDLFEESAKQVTAQGFVTFAGTAGMTSEVALAGDVGSKLIDSSAQTALLHLSTDVLHPLAGVGYLATIALPIDSDPLEATQFCLALNELEMRQTDFVPRLGAWGLRGLDDDLAYTMFLPTDEPFLNVSTVIYWSILRATWIRDYCWDQDRGISVPASVLDE